MITKLLNDGDVIEGADRQLWRVRWVPMKWGEAYLHAERLMPAREVADGNTSVCKSPDHPCWTNYKQLVVLQNAA